MPGDLDFMADVFQLVCNPRDDEVAALADLAFEGAFIERVAGACGVSFDEAFDAYVALPGECLKLAHSLEGWRTLFGLLVGPAALPLVITVH
jgi:hypothetical protein